MKQYDDVRAFLKLYESRDEGDRDMNKRTRISAKAAARMRSEHPGIPEDYLTYLQEIGSGAVRECQYTVYGYFEDPDFFFGERAGRLTIEALCFGDNFSGDIGAFLPTENWAVVEILHDDVSIDRADKTFGEFIREQMLIGSDGRDLRE